ncbi:hypothetical protein BBF96_11630 [Anoxybacter fermentans]|uniref:M23ase beta-sheet core domain-containing protein n=1 Tax=Anoxybacter fermentans TaxID=1323375 RepID=A0A3Q9HRL2_9FIRM|nr:M23 family metallopeptidase [Anoxybacter fermentans]AZR73983.1 hypothetical protein BBF96_11630 [Anoxybacter fermentans]
MEKKNNKKERLPFHIVKDKQNFIRLKIKKTIEEVSKQYEKLPRQLWSSFVIVVGIFLIVLIAKFAGEPQIKPDLEDGLSDPGRMDVVIDEKGRLTTQVPSLPEVKLDGSGLLLENQSEELKEEFSKEPAETTVKFIERSEVSDRIQTEGLKVIYPLRYKRAVITDYGWYFHPILEVWRFHQGVDLRCKKGDLVMASASGKVITVRESDQEAIIVTIDHGNGWKTVYGQIGEVKVKTGDQVVKGQQLGKIGQSVTAIEPHLHFEIIKDDKTVNPRKYLP